MGLPDGVRERLEEAAAEADSWFAIYSKLRELISEGEQQIYRGLVWAFCFDLIGPADPERRLREGSPFGAFIEFEDGRMPPRLEDVPDQDVESWRNAFEAFDDPRIISRLGDLLWERRDQPRPDEKARRACKALLALADLEQWSVMETTEGLVRALEISRAISDPKLTGQTVARMARETETELAVGSERPGVMFSLLSALVDLPAALRPPALDRLIDRSEEVYGGDPFHTETAIELRASLATVDQLPELRERQVVLWRDHGRRSEGLLKSSFLERALDLARTHGLAALASDIRVELQSISAEEMDLKILSAEVKVPSEEINAFIGQFVRFDRWQDSLTAFGIHGPPGGEPEVLDARVAEIRAAHPMQFLVTRTLLDADLGVPIFHATDPATHERAARATQHLLTSRIWATFATSILDRFSEAYGHPAQQELAEFFTTDIILPSTAATIAHAFELHWSGASDDAAHILAPRLETIIRELARQVGLPIIREPVGDQPGGWRSLGSLLHDMEGRLPTAGWRAYLIHLLVDPLGLNLRNVIAHGVRERIDGGDTALLLHATSFLRLVRIASPPGTGPE